MFRGSALWEPSTNDSVSVVQLAGERDVLPLLLRHVDTAARSKAWPSVHAASFQPEQSAPRRDAAPRLRSRICGGSVGFDRCGIDGCLGDPGGFASPSVPAAVKVALGAGLLMFAALGLTP